MKLKSLILTSLVALALGACSTSSDDATGNNANASKEALLQINLGFANMTSTRALPTEGSTTIGSDAENNVSSITVRVQYASTSISKTFTRATGTTLVPESDTFIQQATDANNKMPYLLSTFKVQAGTAVIYVTANSDKTGTGDASTDLVGTYTALDGLTADGAAAAPSKFIMTGKSGSVTLEPNVVNTPADIYLDRVVAKLQEVTPTTGFAITNKITVVSLATGATEVTTATGQQPEVKFLNYGLYNLNSDSYLFAQTKDFAPTAYLFPFTAKYKDNAAAFTALPTTKAIGATANETYCYENDGTPTEVVYEAEVNGGEDFYMVKDKTAGTYTMYTSFAALDKANNGAVSAETGFNLTKDSNADAFYKYGIVKYTAGKCYYRAKVYTTTTDNNKILRNNWYIMNVSTVANIGANFVDAPDFPDNITWLKLTIKVNPWTYRINNFNL
jgi:hypothetical protein